MDNSQTEITLDSITEEAKNDLRNFILDNLDIVRSNLRISSDFGWLVQEFLDYNGGAISDNLTMRDVLIELLNNTPYMMFDDACDLEGAESIGEAIQCYTADYIKHSLYASVDGIVDDVMEGS